MPIRIVFAHHFSFPWCDSILRDVGQNPQFLFWAKNIFQSSVERIQSFSSVSHFNWVCGYPPMLVIKKIPLDYSFTQNKNCGFCLRSLTPQSFEGISSQSIHSAFIRGQVLYEDRREKATLCRSSNCRRDSAGFPRHILVLPY